MSILGGLKAAMLPLAMPAVVPGGNLRPVLDAIRAAAQRVAEAQGRRDQVHAAIAKLEAAIETVEQQREALATKIRQGSVAVALADGPADDVDLGALREEEATAIRREGELRRTVGDLREKLTAVEAGLDAASKVHREAQVEALWRVVNDDVIEQYMDAAKAFTAITRRMFALEQIMREATGVSVMLLAPGAARDCYVPALNGAPSEALYRGKDHDALFGLLRKAVEAERSKLAAMGIHL